MRTIEEFKEIYKEQIKGMTKEEAIKHLEEIEFSLDMIDRWSEETKNAWDAVTKLIKELKGVE